MNGTDAHQLLPVVMGFHIAHRACLAADDHGMGDGPLSMKMHAAQEGSPGNAGGGKKDVVAPDQTVDVAGPV